MRVIGLYGPRRSGKDSLCRYLQEIDPTIKRVAFADALKEDLRPLFADQFGVDVFTLEGEMKEKLRPILIAYGCAWRAVQDLHWVKVVNLKIQNEVPEIVCGVDFRFPDEADYFRQMYGRAFYLVGLVREGAPEPTDEEKKHEEEMAKRVNHWLNIPELKDISELRDYAAAAYEGFQDATK